MMVMVNRLKSVHHAIVENSRLKVAAFGMQSSDKNGSLNVQRQACIGL